MVQVQVIEDVFSKAAAGKRLSRADALLLYRESDLLGLAQLADRQRRRLNPGNLVTYLIDRNINYTNVCSTDCSFCGFYRSTSDHPQSYVLSKEELAQKIEEAIELGATRILMQGGHNVDLSYNYYVDLIKWLHENFKIELNCFSPSEIHHMHLISDKSYHEILCELQQAGMRGLPGGGAEILDDDVRRRVSPKKIMSEVWLEIMEIAQSLGLTTTATMVIGFGETIEQRINHLDGLRNLQDKSKACGYEGFNAFISWTLQYSENTSMGRSRHVECYGVDSVEYLRNVALARLYLDNIAHHQASWPTLGTDIGKMALYFGCDDFGSTMMEENVVSQAGALTQSKWSISPQELRMHIQDAGFTPAQRNTAYQTLQVFDDLSQAV